MKKSMRMLSKLQLCFVSILLLTAAAGCSSAGKANVMPAMKVTADFKSKAQKVVVAKTRTLDQYLNVPALITYDRKAELFFKINHCNLKAFYVNTGDSVEKGQLLAELDSADLEYQITARQIDLKRVQLKVDRIKGESEMDSSDRITQLKSLKLDMESIELAITHLKKQVSETKLVAPISGIVSDIKGIQPGTMVQAYDKLITIYKPDSLKLESDILNPYEESDTDISGIVTGMKVLLIYGSKDTYTEIPATITEIINTDPGVSDDPNRILSAPPPFKVTVKPDGLNADKLSADRTVTLRIKTRTLENVVVLPWKALRGYEKDHLVKVVKGDKVITRSVTTGYESKEDDIVVIKSGLLPGESIITK